MNSDFHYYATYVAARLSDYSYEDAQKLAHAAQYVDDSKKSRLKDKNGNYYIQDFFPIPTAHSLTELGEATTIGWTEAFLDETARVWPVFHFLPGNYTENRKYARNYAGKEEDAGIFSYAKWKYDDEAKEQFYLMCLPNSLIVEKMINDLKGSTSLHEIGLRMHTLADTWAHMYYSGIPAWFINEVTDIKTLRGDPVSMPEESTEAKEIELTIDMPFYNSYMYLGHAQSEYRPDNPYTLFSFKPQWSANTITKDNQKDFLLAVLQMAEALSCIKQSKEFKVNEYKDIDTSNKKIIEEILGTKVSGSHNYQTEIWKKRIPEIKVNGKNLTVPGNYDADKWLKDMKIGGDIKNTDYYKFNAAAVKHLAFVKRELKLNRIYLDDIPAKRVLNFKIKNSADKFIAPGEKSIINFKYPIFYPKVSDQNEVTLEFIMPNDNSDKLLCGTIFKIKTTENAAGNSLYLGAWAYSYLYYYTKDWNIFKQKWTIEQPGKLSGEAVDFSKPVYIKNMHYNDKPYLCLYNNSYLTTDAGKYEWYLEPKDPQMPYVTDLKVITSSDEKVNPPEGFKKIHVDLNANKSKNHVYLCYKLGNDLKAAITNIYFVSHKDKDTAISQTPPGYTRIEEDLNKGAGEDSNYIYLCYKRDADNAPLTDLRVIYGKDAEADKGLIKITNDLNKGAGTGSGYVYLTVKHARPYYIADIKVLYGKDTLAPEGYYRLPGDLNKGTGSDSENIFLYYKLGKDPKAAVTDLFIASDENESKAKQKKPEGYDIIEVDLNKGAGGNFIYLCYKKDKANIPITDLKILFNDKKAGYGFIKINNDLNKGSGNDTDYIYLAYRKRVEQE